MKKLSKTKQITEERLYEILSSTMNDFSVSIEERFNKLESKFDDLKDNTNTKFDLMVKRLDDIDANLAVQGRDTDSQGETIKNHEMRIKVLESAKN